jgi:hypothetical protein
VRKGAREACFVTAFEEEGQHTRFRKMEAAETECADTDQWVLFDLP